jgi:hypothetical protein
MTKRKAISILKKHRNKLATINIYDHYFLWERQALTYVGNFLGDDSESYRLISSFHFPDVQERNYDETISALKTRLLECMDQSIETLKNIGIKQTTYHNLFCRFSDKDLIYGSIGIASAIFTAGIFIGRWLSNHHI